MLVFAFNFKILCNVFLQKRPHKNTTTTTNNELLLFWNYNYLYDTKGQDRLATY